MSMWLSEGYFSMSYRGFHFFRVMLAKHAGYELSFELDESGLKIKNTAQFEKDILSKLLTHSDCDGYFSKKNLVPLALRLEELLPKIKDSEDVFSYGSVKDFICSLLLAHVKGKRLYIR